MSWIDDAADEARAYDEAKNCPKENCGRPESTHRYSAGKKLSICGNGHSWDAAEVAAQRAKARDAQRQEHEFRIRISPEEVRKHMERVYGGRVIPPRYKPSYNPFDDV